MTTIYEEKVEFLKKTIEELEKLRVYTLKDAELDHAIELLETVRQDIKSDQETKKDANYYEDSQPRVYCGLKTGINKPRCPQCNNDNFLIGYNFTCTKCNAVVPPGWYKSHTVEHIHTEQCYQEI